ncbi:hypothetical protein V5O48_016296 [Marasmius crinis-equi]|uniref:Uncharacterized protein n=1 Tax=Marasmius crinis-equi TaxID=585013 RepID=A0ABR3ESA6_9AGAR
MKPDTKNCVTYNSYAQPGDSRPFGIVNDSSRQQVKRTKQKTWRESTSGVPPHDTAPTTANPPQKDPQALGAPEMGSKKGKS